jgi:predicted enzyme related to lactoylglutathione lyase
MLSSERAFGGFSVDDIPAAASFYRDTLGVAVAEQPNGLLSLTLPGGSEVLVYPKPDHAPAAFTILNFVVADIEAATDELAAAGAQMLRYEDFAQDERGISRIPGGPAIAWFTDPAGNILSLLQE